MTILVYYLLRKLCKHAIAIYSFSIVSCFLPAVSTKLIYTHIDIDNRHFFCKNAQMHAEVCLSVKTNL